MNHPVCFQHSQPASPMALGLISAYSVVSLHMWKNTISAEEFKEALEQHTVVAKMIKTLCLYQTSVTLVGIAIKISTKTSVSYHKQI